MKSLEDIRKEFKKKWVNGDITYHLRKKTSIEDDADDISQYWCYQIEAREEELRQTIKDMPTICGVCNKSGVNTYGECRCSYEESKYIKKSSVLALLPKKK